MIFILIISLLYFKFLIIMSNSQKILLLFVQYKRLAKCDMMPHMMRDVMSN